ncbi:MAG: tRNA uridine-5-carboxymethylaminomethyl(34) synthesis GTPase MnmE [Oscillospiraceae bacterium]|nr:tRNA uridine-5-carboxymethylaminomethyl(34) synthesis GTPase MnmE [Oscillospiraceae bacterium]
MADTIAAIATGNVLSAIGIVRLSGDRAIELASALFLPMNGRKLDSCADRTLIYGKAADRKGNILDLCLCTIAHAPNSYTGEDTAEFQCHGSPVVLRSLLDELFFLGARQALPGEFTKRAFLNGKMELTAAEAVADLIDAETKESVVNAAGQLSGAIDRKMVEIYSRLTDISSHYHAVLDYPDEDIEPFRMEAYARELEDITASLEKLLASFDRGRLMTSGIPAVIVGKPNVGKSSLLNALLGYERAIVTQVPGTTRDTIEEKVMIGKVSLRLTDTAGIRETEDLVESIGVERSRRAMNDARLVIAVVDGSTEPDREDLALVKEAEKAPKGLVILSKKDLSDREIYLDTSLPVIRLSALTGQGIEELEKTIEEEFPEPDVPAGEILTNTRHASAVGRALESMRAALEAMRSGNTPDIVLTETEGAMQAIGELTGRTIREDVTDRIFERFCVGK